jgi:ferrochelatase
MAKTGVLLVGFGAPDSFEAIEPFMRNLMGRDPSEELLGSARRRYLTIGGSSPLPWRVEGIAAALERRLNGLPPAEHQEESPEEYSGAVARRSTRVGGDMAVPVAVGMAYWHPTILEGLGRLKAAGAESVVWLSLSPFESGATTGTFRAAVEQASVEAGIEATELGGFHTTHDFAVLLADACSEALQQVFPAHRPVVVFTAHSLPVDDPGVGEYVTQLEALATNVAAIVGFGEPDPEGLEAVLRLSAHGGPGTTTPWLLAYQSKGERPGEWIGPALDEVTDAVFTAGYGSVAVCPIGFVTDHLETLYDLDVEVADQALCLEMEYARATVPNDDPRMIEILARAVEPRL